MAKKTTEMPIDGGSQKRDTSVADDARKAKLVIYQEKLGDVPLLRFLDGLKVKDRMEVLAMLEELSKQGHELRPPHNEHLGEQLYYLRVRGEDGNYRVFYFPHGKGVCVLGHGFSKKTSKCPPTEVKRAEKMRKRFVADPAGHTYEEHSDGDQKDN